MVLIFIATFEITINNTKLSERSISMIGKVKWFDNKKGYGFILAEDGHQVFVHYTAVVTEGFKSLSVGQSVEYEIGENEKGVQAVNVKVVAKK